MADDPEDREDGPFGRERDGGAGDRDDAEFHDADDLDAEFHDAEFHDADDLDADGLDADDLDDLDLGEPASEAGAGHTALPAKVEAWRRRSAAGAILTGFALGLQEALEKRKEEPSIVMETSGDPPRDLPVEADFEYGRPRQSIVQIRPWLLADGSPSSESSDSAAGRAAPTGDASPSPAPSPGADHPGDGEPA